MKFPINFRAPFALGMLSALSMLVGVVACGPAATAGPPTPTTPITSLIDIFRIVDLRELDADQCDTYNTHAVMHAASGDLSQGFWAIASKTEAGETVRFTVANRCLAGTLSDSLYPPRTAEDRPLGIEPAGAMMSMIIHCSPAYAGIDHAGPHYAAAPARFPAHARIDLRCRQFQTPAEGIPRIRRDRPNLYDKYVPKTEVPPHTRG